MSLSGYVNYTYISRLSDRSLINIPYRMGSLNFEKQSGVLSLNGNFSLEYHLRDDSYFLGSSNPQDFILDLRELYLTWYIPMGEIKIGKKNHDKVKDSTLILLSKGEDLKVAASKGAYEVGIPVIFAVLTTIATFSPMLFVEGSVGRIWRIIPLVVIPTLFWSLIESLSILPAHLAHMKSKKHKSNLFSDISKKWEKFQFKIETALKLFIKNKYNYYIFVCIAIILGNLFSQNNSISGWVLDYETNKPIKDVSLSDIIVGLFDTARRFKLEVQPQLILMQKTF